MQRFYLALEVSCLPFIDFSCALKEIFCILFHLLYLLNFLYLLHCIIVIQMLLTSLLFTLSSVTNLGGVTGGSSISNRAG